MTPEIAQLYCIAKRIDEYGPKPKTLEALCAALVAVEGRNYAGENVTDKLWARYCKRERLSGTGPHRGGKP